MSVNVFHLLAFFLLRSLLTCDSSLYLSSLAAFFLSLLPVRPLREVGVFFFLTMQRFLRLFLAWGLSDGNTSLFWGVWGALWVGGVYSSSRFANLFYLVLLAHSSALSFFSFNDRFTYSVGPKVAVPPFCLGCWCCLPLPQQGVMGTVLLRGQYCSLPLFSPTLFLVPNVGSQWVNGLGGCCHGGLEGGAFVQRKGWRETWGGSRGEGRL